MDNSERITDIINKNMAKIKGVVKINNVDRGATGAEAMFGVTMMSREFSALRQDTIEVMDKELERVDEKINEVENLIKEGANKIDAKVADFEKTAVNLIKDIQALPYVKGDAGKDADHEKIVKDVVAQLPTEEEILAKIPKLDEDALMKKFVAKIPENKASLKIIQEKIEMDPMGVIDAIMKMPEGTFKLSTGHIDGLDQTIRAIHHQLGTGGSRAYLHGGGDTVVAGTNITITANPNGTKTISATGGGGGSGTVTSVSVVSANGFAGSVANATTTPAITLSTTITGLLKGNGTAISAAVAGTDYQVPITLTTTGSSGAATFIGGVLNIPQYTAGTGTVTSVSVVTANGISGSVATATTTPAITLTLGAITPTTVNGITFSGSGSIANSGTTALTSFTGSGTSSGTNTGDQNLFSSVIVSGQTTVTVNSATTALTLVAGTNITLTTDNTAKTVTITSSGGGSGLTVGTTTITSGTTTRILYDNAGTLGEYTISGSGTVVAMATSPSFTTPSLGAATYTTLSGGNITDSGLTAGRVTFAGTAGILSDSGTFLFTISNPNAILTLGTIGTATNVGQIKLGYSGGVADNFITLTPAGGTSGAKTITIPNATDTLVGQATTDTLTNKTLTSAKITTNLSPTTNDGAALGGTTLQFSDIFLATGAVVNFSNGDYTITHSTGLLTFNSNLNITAGNLKIGGTAARGTTEGTNELVLFNGTAPVGTLTNGASFYAAAGEMRVMDSAGNSTLLSPHDDETNEWVFYSKNTRTGKVLKIDMERLMRALDTQLGGGYIEEYFEDPEIDGRTEALQAAQ